MAYGCVCSFRPKQKIAVAITTTQAHLLTRCANRHLSISNAAAGKVFLTLACCGSCLFADQKAFALVS